MVNTPVPLEPECERVMDLLLGEGVGPGRPVALLNVEGFLAGGGEQGTIDGAT